MYLGGVFMHRFHHLLDHGVDPRLHSGTVHLTSQCPGVHLTGSEAEVDHFVGQARELVAEAESEESGGHFEWYCVTLSTGLSIERLASR